MFLLTGNSIWKLKFNLKKKWKNINFNKKVKRRKIMGIKWRRLVINFKINKANINDLV